MRVAIPVWNGRVSPVFDVARDIRIIDIEDTGVESSGFETHVVNSGRPASILAGLGVDLLVCAAISSPLETAVRLADIQVLSDICGSPDEIVAALATGDMELHRFHSPGSGGKIRRLAERPSGREIRETEPTG